MGGSEGERVRESEGARERVIIKQEIFFCVMIISNMQEVEEENVSKEKHKAEENL